MHFVDCDRPAHRAEILNPFELAKKVLSFMLHTVEPFYTLHHRYKLDVIQTTGRQKTAINECSLGAQGEPTSQVKGTGKRALAEGHIAANNKEAFRFLKPTEDLSD